MSRTLEIDRSLHGHIVGTGGSTIRQLQSEHSVRINVPRPNEESDQVVVTGENVDAACAAIDALVSGAKERQQRAQERERRVTEEHEVPRARHAFLIGPRGANIQRIQQECGARISVPKDTPKDSVSITGTPEQVEAARVAIDALLTSTNSMPSDQSGTSSRGGAPMRRGGGCEGTLQIQCSEQKYVIGTGGKNIRKLREDSGAEIRVPPPNSEASPDDWATITIYADSDAKVEHAKVLIQRLLSSIHEEREEERRRRLEEYTKHTDAVYKKHQAKVDKCAQKRADYFQRAAEAFEKGEKALAKELSEKGHEETRKMKDAQAHAAFSIYKAKNKGNADHVVDLHGLHVEPALEILAAKFATRAQLRARRVPAIEVITGKGIHSDGEIRLLPAVLQWLQGQCIRYDEQPEEGTVLAYV